MTGVSKDGSSAGYSYDALGRMTALTGKNGSTAGTGNMAQGDDGGVSVNVVGSGFVSHSTVTEEVGERAKRYDRNAPQEIRIYYRDIRLIDEMPETMTAEEEKPAQTEAA